MKGSQCRSKDISWKANEIMQWSDNGGFDQAGEGGVVRNGQILNFGSISWVELTRFANRLAVLYE